MNNLSFPVLALSSLVFVACVPGTAQNMQDTSKSDDDMMMYDEDAMMADDQMMGTAALEEGCSALSAKSSADKMRILDEIGHNMDHNALDAILGNDCSFLGSVTKVADLHDNDLKFNPNDSEVLYYNAETNRFFATCQSLNTIAYVVEKKDASKTPSEYFSSHRSEFRSAAQMAKDMMDEMMMENEGGEAMMNDDHMMQASVGEYRAYEEGVIGNGEESVLFFHAKWCPDCRANDGRLQKWYPSDDLVSVYKLDYDTATDLKKRYGVVQQDTFVRIDSSGNAVESVSFPKEERLMSIVTKS